MHGSDNAIPGPPDSVFEVAAAMAHRRFCKIADIRSAGEPSPWCRDNPPSGSVRPSVPVARRQSS